ncbi:MAG: c-type cytochrome biogenesis protein CcsB [Chloroflexota bacterium]|nr:c-type cytochrome biogenesis protein CcsB [Chloroflexota bacterium]
MGFESATLGFNEPTLTSLAYICYLLAFLSFSAHLLTKAGRTVHVVQGTMALAGAGVGGNVDVTVTSDGETRRPSAFSPLAGRVAAGLVVAAWLSLTTALVLRWVEIGHYPTVTLYEIVTMLVWGTTTIYLILFEAVLKTRAAGAFVVVLIFCLQSYALWFIPADLKRPIPLVPALRSYWLMIHVSMAIISYSPFATAAGAGLTFLAKHYQKGRLAAALPSGAAIEEFMFRAVAVGFPFMTLVLITGAVWANEAWTKAWSWDPKEVWALVTWLTYAAYLHVRVQRGVRGVTMAWLSLIGFVVVLITFMGVNYMVQWFGLDSMHVYTQSSTPQGGIGVAGLLTVLFLFGLLILALFSWLRIKFPSGRRAPGKQM